jgi:ribosomal protein L11
MAKKVKVIIKVNLKAAEASPAPPLGPALGSMVLLLWTL